MSNHSIEEEGREAQDKKNLRGSRAGLQQLYDLTVKVTLCISLVSCWLDRSAVLSTGVSVNTQECGNLEERVTGGHLGGWSPQELKRNLRIYLKL